jgi:ribose transport system substrate-binding protein
MKKTLRWIIVALISAMVVFSFSVAGCKQPAPTEEATTTEAAVSEETKAEETKAETEKFTVAMVPAALVSPYYIESSDSAKEAAAKYENMEFTVLSPSDETKTDEMVKILEDLLQKKVDLILISVSNWEAAAPLLKQARESGTEVAIYNLAVIPAELEGLGIISAVGVDEVEGGKVAGTWVSEVLNGKGNIAILEGIAGDFWTVNTGKGVDTILADYPDIKIVARQPANWERAKGMQVAEDILQANEELDLICAFNDNMALGSAQAVENAGRKNEIKISGYNGNVEALEAIVAGKIDATVDKQPRNVGQKLIDEIAVKLMEGKKDEVEQIIKIIPVLITADNVNDFLKK